MNAEKSNLDQLPVETIVQIMENMNLASIEALCNTNKRLRDIWNANIKPDIERIGRMDHKDILALCKTSPKVRKMYNTYYKKPLILLIGEFNQKKLNTIVNILLQGFDRADHPLNFGAKCKLIFQRYTLEHFILNTIQYVSNGEEVIIQYTDEQFIVDMELPGLVSREFYEQHNSERHHYERYNKNNGLERDDEGYLSEEEAELNTFINELLWPHAPPYQLLF